MSHPFRPIILNQLPLLVLPILFIVATMSMRNMGGPFWLSHLLDPSYFYLLDALNMVSLQTPGVIYHPGSTVHLITGLVLKLAYPFTASTDIVTSVLGDPERHLKLFSTAFVALQAAMLIGAGWVVRHVTGSLILAGLIQIAPFLSMLVLKNAYHVKPEPLLVVTVLALVSVMFLALRPGALERHRWGYPIALGLIAGFGVATKLTAAPLFILPFFILPPALYWRFVVAGALGLVLFTLPVVASYPEMISYFAQIIVSSGEYGRGPGTVIDPDKYIASVAKLVQRPIISVSIIAALAGAGLAWFRRNRLDHSERRRAVLLFGLAAAIVAHVLVLGKQPASFYLIPSIVLAPAIFVMIGTLYAETNLSAQPRSSGVKIGLGTLLLALVVGQGFATVEEAEELATKRALAQSMDMNRFQECTQIFYYAASHPSYALYLGNHVAGQRFNRQLQTHIGPRTYWLNDFFPFEPDQLEGVGGAVAAQEVVTQSRCTVFRGSAGRGQFAQFIAGDFGSLRMDASCRVGIEVIQTRGIKCDGTLVPEASHSD